MPHGSKISSLSLVPVPNYRTWIKTTPQKKQFFWSIPYKIEVTITSLTKMLKLPNLTTSTIKFESRDKTLLHDTMGRNDDVITFILKYYCFKKTWGSYFCAEIIKIIITFIKKIFKDLRKIKRIRNNASIYYICISWYNKICWFPVKKCWCQQNAEGVSHDSYIF